MNEEEEFFAWLDGELDQVTRQSGFPRVSRQSRSWPPGRSSIASWRPGCVDAFYPL